MHSYYAGKWQVKDSRPFVLILVLMDDALVRGMTFIPLSNNSVLILVLMDDALVRWKSDAAHQKGNVLILVLMDDALVLQNLGYALFKRIVRLVCAS